MRTLSLRIASLLLVAAAPLAQLAACSSEEGTTPTCSDDLGENGNTRLDDGCNPFPSCVNAAGKVVDPRECCIGTDGKPYTGNTLKECLYGFAVTASSSGSGGGAGGAGGGGAGGAGGAGGGG